MSLLSLHEVMFARRLGSNFVTATNVELKEAFKNWNARVIGQVAAERLLIFNPSEGWGPLCRFLDLPEPDVPFPHANKREEMVKVLHTQLRRGVLYDRVIFNVLTLFIFCCVLLTFHMLPFEYPNGDVTYFFFFLNICFVLSYLFAKAIQERL